MFYRRLRTPNTWQEMERLQSEMNRLFDGYHNIRRQPAPTFPAVNVWTNQEDILVTAETPGIKPEDIDISVVNEMLTISGKRNPDTVEQDARYHRQERGFGDFSRTIQLPYTVEATKVEATFRQGVLNITLPRKEADKPKKIKVSLK